LKVKEKRKQMKQLRENVAGTLIKELSYESYVLIYVIDSVKVYKIF